MQQASQDVFALIIDIASYCQIGSIDNLNQ